MSARHIIAVMIGLLCGGCMEPEPRGKLELWVLGPAYPRARCARGDGSTGKSSSSMPLRMGCIRCAAPGSRWVITSP